MKRSFALGISLLLAVAARAQTSNNPAPLETGSPTIVFESNNYEFGKVTQGDPIMHDFVVSNSGTATLNIRDVHPSCGCTTAGSWPHELAPGKSGLIPIQVNSKNLSGAIHKTVTITSNDQLHKSSVLQITGTVTKPIDVSPPYAIFKTIAGDTNLTPVTVKVSNRTGNPLTLTAPSEPGAFTVTGIKPVADGNDFEVTIAANPPYDRGTNATILLNTGWSNYTVRVQAYLTVQQPITIQPHAITIPQNVQRDTTFKVSLFSVRQEDTFSDPEVSDSRISVSLTNLSTGKPIYTLAAIVPAGYKAAPGKPASITVKTTDAHAPTITIPIVQTSFNPGFQAPNAALRARQPLPAISSSSAATAPPAPAPAAAPQAH